MSARLKDQGGPQRPADTHISAVRKNAAIRALGWVALHVQATRWQTVCPCCLHFNLMVDGSLDQPTSLHCTNCDATDPQKIHAAQVRHIQDKLKEIERHVRSA